MRSFLLDDLHNFQPELCYVQASEIVGWSQLFQGSSKDGDTNVCLIFLEVNECCGNENDSLNDVSIISLCGMPNLLENLVSFPEPFFIEQFNSFSQSFVLVSCGGTIFNAAECNYSGDLFLENIPRGV